MPDETYTLRIELFPFPSFIDCTAFTIYTVAKLSLYLFGQHNTKHNNIIMEYNSPHVDAVWCRVCIHYMVYGTFSVVIITTTLIISFYWEISFFVFIVSNNVSVNISYKVLWELTIYNMVYYIGGLFLPSSFVTYGYPA